MQSNNGSVQKAAPSYISSGQAATLMAWFAIAASYPGPSVLLGNSSPTVGGSLVTTASGSTRGQLGITRNNIATTQSNYYILDGFWHHLAITYSNSATIIYVDGVNFLSIGAVNAFNTGAAIVCECLSGYIAHFAAWNSTLSQANIQSVYNAPASIVEPDFSTTGTAVTDINTSLTTISADLTTIEAKLDQIIAAVIRTYSP